MSTLPADGYGTVSHSADPTGRDVADVPDDRHGGDVSVVGFEDRLDVFDGFGVLRCWRCLPCVGMAAVVRPGAVEELVRARRGGPSVGGGVVAAGLDRSDGGQGRVEVGETGAAERSCFTGGEQGGEDHQAERGAAGGDRDEFHVPLLTGATTDLLHFRGLVRE